MTETQETKEKQVVPAEPKPTITTALAPTGGLIPKDFESLYRVAKIMAASGMMPEGLQTPEAVFVAVEMGLEVGLSPMQATQNIAVINGRPAIWGDAVLGLVRASGKLTAFKEYFKGKWPENNFTAICEATRGDSEVTIREFSIADAKRAGLWVSESADYKKKLSPWWKYPKRMLQMRARSWALRDLFGDVLKGLRVAEEAQDYDIDLHRSPATGSYEVPDPEKAKKDLKAKLGKPKSAMQDTEYLPTNETVEGDAEPAPATPPPKTAPDTAGLSDLGDPEPTPDPPLVPGTTEQKFVDNEKLDPTAPWYRGNWAKLRKAGYSTFVFKHLEDINKGAPADVKKEMTAKWNKFYQEPCPILIGTKDMLTEDQQTGKEPIPEPEDNAPDSWREPVEPQTDGVSTAELEFKSRAYQTAADTGQDGATLHSRMVAYIQFVMKTTEFSEARQMALALEDWDRFVEYFTNWTKGGDTEQPQPEQPEDDGEESEKAAVRAAIIDSFAPNDIIKAQLALGFAAGLTALPALSLDALTVLRDHLTENMR